MAKYNKLAGKHIVVIGGSNGIGRGVVEASLESGARVTLSGSSPQSAEAAVSALKKEYPSPQLVGLNCDLSNATVEADLESLLRQAVAAHDGAPIDHIVLTAADNLSIVPLQDMTPEVIAKATHMRMLVPILVGKLAQRHLRPSANCSLTLTTGSIADKPMADWSLINFLCTGIVGLTRNLALDLQPRRVNIVEPGLVDTGLWDTTWPTAKEREEGLRELAEKLKLPVGKAGGVEEVAEAYVYLMRDRNATGEVVKTRGGSHLV
ncbi:Uu.00g117760.m01.CDS01 [Anthostomella pinea]|uniref:Uu.00g117760.m01.CDS01 n=1 Tax=Anthostomella pinea TaxID=933095 RepID=A0AAI8YH37_9PEZI|nr:Uu.00g117760.m01.CDS01 [Anthostomella pinea]